MAVPFVIVYLVVAWVLFVPAAEKRGTHYWIDEDAVGHLLYRMPDLTENPVRALRALVTAPWINHDSLQLVYVTALLLTFGIAFEAKEGTGRLMAVFFGTSAVAAVASGLLLDAIYPQLWDTRVFEVAWNRFWTGGSAGCFGVLGAFAARARRPVPLLTGFLLWESVIWWTVLQNYASAFHLTALASGYLFIRYVLPPIRPTPDES
jgi:hypothetical protein